MAEPQRVRGEKAPRDEEPQGEGNDEDHPRLRPIDQPVRRPLQESSSDWDSDDEREVAAAAARRAAARSEELVDMSRKGIAFGVDFLRKQRERAARRQDVTSIQLDDRSNTVQPTTPSPRLQYQSVPITASSPQLTVTTTTSSGPPFVPSHVVSTPNKTVADIQLSQGSSSLFVEDVVTSPNSATAPTTATTIKAEAIDVDEEEVVVEKQWGTVVEEETADNEVEDTTPEHYQEVDIEDLEHDDNDDGGGPVIYDSASPTPEGLSLIHI
eukprot:TRINITY_DN21920_c0_g1_i1.p1 TRINITY_DN21920_c0_g1~~TRINITY_DN21920_c0_g1_i1.p1  ORF type:complete len:269 (-),score=52.42 TRINITY_DN21920_c0_g1_i1:120-926(-)